MRILDNAGQAEHEHRLWWTPGTRGRGVLFESGLVCTWPEDDATHRQWADRVQSRPVMFFYIRKDGRVRIPERHAQHAPRLTSVLTAADPRLAPFAPPRHARPPAAPPPDQAGCQTSSTGGHGSTPRRSVYHAWDVNAPEQLARIQRRY